MIHVVCIRESDFHSKLESCGIPKYTGFHSIVVQNRGNLSKNAIFGRKFLNMSKLRFQKVSFGLNQFDFVFHPVF